MEAANVSCWEICIAVLLVWAFFVCFEKGINYIGFYSFSHSFQLFLLLCCPMYIPLSYRRLID